MSQQALRTGGKFWGPERVRLGMSLTELAARSGIRKQYLSLIETGRMVPTTREYEAVMTVIREAAGTPRGGIA